MEIEDLQFWGCGFGTPRLHQIKTRILIQCKATDFSGFQCFFGENVVEEFKFLDQIYRILCCTCTPIMFLELGVCIFLLGCALFSGNKSKVETRNVSIEQYKERVDEIIKVIKEQEGLLTEFDGKIFNALIDRIEDLESTHFIFVLKNGMRVEERI